MQSLSRSAALTKGSRWQVFGIALLIGIGAFAASYVVERTFGDGILGSFVSWIVAAAISAFAASVTAVGYTTLRFAKGRRRHRPDRRGLRLSLWDLPALSRIPVALSAPAP